MNQGWQCPKCLTVWNPSVQKCALCSPAAVPTWIGWPPPYWYPWTPPTWGPVTVTCTTTACPEGYTSVVYNDTGVSVFNTTGTKEAN